MWFIRSSYFHIATRQRKRTTPPNQIFVVYAVNVKPCVPRGALCAEMYHFLASPNVSRLIPGCWAFVVSMQRDREGR